MWLWTGVHNLDEHSLFYYPDPSLVFLLLHAEVCIMYKYLCHASLLTGLLCISTFKAIPWPFSELQARVVAAYWSGTPFDINPYPDEDSESHSILVLGHPGEYALFTHILWYNLLFTFVRSGSYMLKTFLRWSGKVGKRKFLLTGSGANGLPGKRKSGQPLINCIDVSIL